MEFRFLPNRYVDPLMLEFPIGTRVRWHNTSPIRRENSGTTYIVEGYVDCDSNCSVCGGGRRLVRMNTGGAVCKSWLPQIGAISGYYEEVID